MGHKLRLDAQVDRLDQTRVRVRNPYGVPVTLLARADVPVEPEGIEELLRFLSLTQTNDQIAAAAPGYFGDAAPAIEEVVLTPDFHKGSGIPVGTVAAARGFVVPAAIGNDICCGMRLLVTDIPKAQLQPRLPQLMQRLRGIFFLGERDIPLSPRQREGLLRDGLPGLWEARDDNAGKGLWRYYDPAAQSADLARVHFGGGLRTDGLFAFSDYVRSSGLTDARDPQIGSVGGGNHFVEIQSVTEILDGQAAHGWGVQRDLVTIMVHSGSVALGHAVGGHFSDRARGLFPRGLPHPDHGFYVLPTEGPHAAEARRYLSAMNNAANFAFGNRLFLGLMALRALSEVLGRPVSSRLVYDAPHNLIWEPGAEGGRGRYLHRKGACPALGPAPDEDGPFRYSGHPVIIPGSMGDASYLLVGQGNQAALESACHGAGRSLTRGQATHVAEDTYQRALSPLRVVTPLDPDAPQVKLRRDILAKHHLRLKEEAPYAYKPVTPVVETVEEAGVARRVARLWPLLTVKG